ncbi:hypothetical protein P8882_01660 [Bacillus haynesii]|nr:hypothetical protein [Bacillus haynesii]MEC0756483.1 hypothetical protein [Bacillus haynesii]
MRPTSIELNTSMTKLRLGVSEELYPHVHTLIREIEALRRKDEKSDNLILKVRDTLGDWNMYNFQILELISSHFNEMGDENANDR